MEKVKEIIRYVPAWNGNRKKKEKRVVVELSRVSYGDSKNYAKEIKRKLTDDGEVEDNAGEVQEKQFLEHVGKIENLVDLVTEEPITDARALYEAGGYQDLVKELLVATENVSILSEGLAKKFERPSGGG